MLNKEAIYQLIKDNEFPCWILYQLQGFNSTVLVRKYFCENVEKDAPLNEKIERSIEALENTLNLWRTGGKFFIDLSNKREGNGTSKTGKIEFFVESTAPVQNNQQTDYFNGLGQLQALNDQNIGLLRREILCDFREREIDKREKELDEDYNNAVEELNNKKISIEETIKKIPELAPYIRDALEMVGFKLPASTKSLSGGHNAQPDDNPQINALNEVAQKVIDSNLSEDNFKALIYAINKILTQIKIQNNGSAKYEEKTE